MLTRIAPLGLHPYRSVVRLASKIADLGEAGDDFHVLDRDAPVVQWLCTLCVAATSTGATVDPVDVEACWLTAANKSWEMSDLMGKWASDPRVLDASN